jgi:hypothetical protein
MTPHLPPAHVRFWQSVSCPGQSAGIWHPAPVPVLLVALPVDPPVPPVPVVLVLLLLVLLAVDPPIAPMPVVVPPVPPPELEVAVELEGLHAATLSSNPTAQQRMKETRCMYPPCARRRHRCEGA